MSFAIKKYGVEIWEIRAASTYSIILQLVTPER